MENARDGHYGCVVAVVVDNDDDNDDIRVGIKRDERGLAGQHEEMHSEHDVAGKDMPHSDDLCCKVLA